MTRLSGRVPETGTAIQGATVAIIDTQGVEDPSQWSVIAFDTTDANGEWSVSGLDASAVERYHAVAQYDDGSSFTNFESLPYLSTPADVFAPETALTVGTPTPTVEVAGAIPGSVVTRPDDDRTFTNTTAFGVRISVSQEWPDIGAEISQNPSGFTRAYVYDVSDGTLMGDVDISALTAGNTFTVGLDSPLQSGNSYNFVVDAEGGSFTQGSKRNANFPFTSADGNLDIVNGAKGPTDPSGDAVNLLRVGDVGF